MMYVYIYIVRYLFIHLNKNIFTQLPSPSPSLFRLLPADALPDDALRLHAPRAVVEVCEGCGH